MSVPPSIDEVLRGGGQLGALMRSMDWARTPVGPVEHWPQSLRTVLSLVLHSPHPLFVWWGSELVQFYNDGCRPLLGTTKHPRALGQRGPECWAEIWDVLAPQLSAVREHGESTSIEDGLLCVERHGYREEAYFTYALSPIPADSGGVGGVLCIGHESTARVLGERRMRTLRELSEALAHARDEQTTCLEAARVLAAHRHDVPFALLYLAEPSGEARLVSAVGLEPGERAAPPRLDARDPDAPWPWASLSSTGQARWLEALPAFPEGLPGGPWPEPTTSALALPLSPSGQERPVGMLVVGLSPRRALDEHYRDFLEVACSHLATAVTQARAHQEERRRVEALAALDRAKTDFFSNVSHEFRTPLTLLLGPVEDALADTEQPLAPRQRQRQEDVQHNAQRLLKLVNQLLDFSRLEGGRVQLHARPTDLAALTTQLASTFRSTLERAGLRLVVDCPPLPAPVLVDRDMWEKVVLNLLSNAFKFTFAGEIRVTLEPLASGVRLSVKDTGTGIPDHELPRLFERFHRVKGAQGRSLEGSGIGLALVRELVKLQGGSVEAQSHWGHGSTFSVTLPWGEARPLGTPVTSGPAWTPSEPPRLALLPGVPHAVQDASAPRLLLVEDDTDLRLYIQRLLGESVTVETVTSAAVALAVARERPPQLVLTDVRMPGMDGLTLLRQLRADPRTAFIPVILLSARAGEEAFVEGMRAGADDYLVKPFSSRELVSRVNARLEIARAHAETRLARARLHSQLMQAPVAMSIVTGSDFRFELANPRYLEMVGRQDVVGRPFREVFSELPDDAPVLEMMRGVCASGQPFTASEFRVPLRRGATGPLEDVSFLFTCQPMLDADERVVGIMTVAVDVTAQVLARQQVERLADSERVLRDRAEQADRRKDEFLAMLAHELRNPLAALDSALELMEHARGDGARLARLRDTSKRQVGTLVRMVDDLLDVSRITRGQVELRRTETDLAALVHHAIGTVRPLIDAREHVLSVTLAPGDFPLLADPTRLEQVLANLFTNAARYTEPGGHISVRLEREQHEGSSQAVLRVRDTGRGIPPAMLEQIFEPFVQVDRSLARTEGGLGIGLTLVQRLVELHGGRVSAHSAGPGQGSEFVVRLPLSPPASRPAPGPSPLEPPRAPSSSPPRVLVVEDSADVREMMKEYLEMLGLEVEVATTGLEGADKVLALRPDVALVDVGLPGIDGYEVARRVRATRGGDSLYLVALTGYGGPEAQAQALQAGFDQHLVKPLDVSELPRVLTAANTKRSTPH